MRKRYLRLAMAGALASIMLLATAIPAHAIENPDSMGIYAVYVYRHCVEEDDQLYIIDYLVDYTPVGEVSTNPDENVTEAYLVRLVSGATELGSTAPYAFYDEGYARGIAAIYFSASEAPTWEGSYSIRLEGNPTLEWAGDPPTTSVSTFNLWSSSTTTGATSIELAARVLYFADLLELAWAVDLIETSGSGSWLTSYGEDYFTNSIPHLQEVCPQVFSAGVTQPVFPTRVLPLTYAATLRANIVGTPLDLSGVADIVGIGTIWLTTAIWVGIMAVVIYGATRKIGTTKPVLIIAAAMVPIGVMIGWLDLTVAILMGFGAIIAIAYVFFLQKSAA